MVGAAISLKKALRAVAAIESRNSFFCSRPPVRKTGFTLVELVAVLGILGILAGVVTLSLTGALTRGEATACEQEHSAIESAVWMYYGEHGQQWPTSDGAMPGDIDFDLLVGGYIERVPSSQAECHWQIDCCGGVISVEAACPCD